MQTLNELAKLSLIALVTGALSLWFLSLLLDDKIALSQCMKKHSYSTCHYALNR